MPDRQRYISPILTHFVGGKLPSDNDRYNCLATILNERWITYPPHDATTRIPGYELKIYHKEDISKGANKMYRPDMVCFCDIPVGDLDIHTGKYGRFGLAFEKRFIAKSGGAPVFYVPKEATPVLGAGEDESGNEYRNRGTYFDDKVRESETFLRELCGQEEWREKAHKVYEFLASSVFAHILCFDHGLDDTDRDNYYFEREWRILGSLQFHISHVRTIFLPNEGRWARRFREDFPAYCGELILL